MTELSLAVRGLRVAYGGAVAVADLTIDVPPGRITALLGPNAAGKSSSLLAIYGATPSQGSVDLGGDDISGQRQRTRMSRGLALVPQGRQLFPQMTVEENLRIAADVRRLPRSSVERGLSLFPVLAERRSSLAGVLSGGQQQMLALSRAMIAEPKVLLLDEAVDGLAAGTVAVLMDAVAELAASGVGVLMAEPTLGTVKRWIDRGYVLIRGRATPAAEDADSLEALYEGQLGLGHAHG